MSNFDLQQEKGTKQNCRPSFGGVGWVGGGGGVYVEGAGRIPMCHRGRNVICYSTKFFSDVVNFLTFDCQFVKRWFSLRALIVC
jgi:hypothetical protein